MEFTQYCPTKVQFGPASLNKLFDYLSEGLNAVLLISSKTAAEKSGAHAIIKRLVESKGIHFYYKNTISPNPRLVEIDALSKYCKDNAIDCLISVGGGSVIDAAKFLSVSAVSQKSCKQILKEKNIDVNPLHHIAIPTTAGTGSEVSKGAIVSDPDSHWKGGLRGEKLFPYAAILDPLLTKSLPKSIAIETGFDVLTHSLESFVSKASTPITELYSKEAIKRAVPALLLFAEDKSTDRSREEIMYASLLAGYNLGNASTCLPHRLQYPLGARTDCPHARGLAALYPAWISKTYDYAQDQFNFFAKTIVQNSPQVFDGKMEFNRDVVVSVVKWFLEKLEINHRLRDFGATESDCSLYVSEIEGNLTLDPGLTDLETLKQIYLESY